MIERVFKNHNANVITSLSRMENDSLLSYLFLYIIQPNHSLYTQNIMYLLKYINLNISFVIMKCDGS